MFAPPKSSVEAVQDWLISAGVAASRLSQSANKQVGWLCTCMTNKAEMCFSGFNSMLQLKRLKSYYILRITYGSTLKVALRILQPPSS